MRRESLARALSLGTGLVVVGAVALFALARTPDAPATEPGARAAVVNDRDARSAAPDTLAALIARGQEVYEEERCAACHSIAGEGSPRYPLDGIGSRLTTDEIRLWIVDPQEIRPGVRKPAYDDLEDDDVHALVVYMASLTLPDP